MRGGLLILGLLILLLTFGFSSSISAQQQSLLQIVGGACNSPLGTIGSALSATVAQECQKINTINLLLNFVPVAYILGGLLFLLGLFIPGNKRSTKEAQQQTVHKDSERAKEEEVKEDEALKQLKLRYAKGEITKKQYEEMKKDLEE